MARPLVITIDEHRVQELLTQGLSERAIAKELQIPRTTLHRHLETLRGVPTVHTVIPKSERTPTVHKGVPRKGTRHVHEEVHTTTQLATSQDDLAELLAWWRERKQLTQTSDDPERETERKTYHVEKRHIAAIERAADLERVSITEIVNRAFRHYFAGKQS